MAAAAASVASVAEGTKGEWNAKCVTDLSSSKTREAMSSSPSSAPDCFSLVVHHLKTDWSRTGKLLGMFDIVIR